jgi:hypothetical protein
MKQENPVTFFSKARMLQLWIGDDCFKFDNHKYETFDTKEIKLLRNYLENYKSGNKPYYEIDERDIIKAKEPTEVIIDGEIVKMEDLKGDFKQKKQHQRVLKGARTNFNAGDSIK